ncbi:hypothetical protein M2137_003086, partial [Parabacteroides sp. PFB2-10]|nr:hypothetical protein [Parabacteroides sp. PFB2-10]
PLCSTPSRSLRSLHWGLLGVKRLWALPAYLQLLHNLNTLSYFAPTNH